MTYAVTVYDLLDEPTGVFLYGCITKTTNDILIDNESLKKHLRKFFDEICKTYWIGSLETQPESYCVRYMIFHPTHSSVERVFMSEWIGGARGYDWVIENNEDIFDLLSDYQGCNIAFGI